MALLVKPTGEGTRLRKAGTRRSRSTVTGAAVGLAGRGKNNAEAFLGELELL